MSLKPLQSAALCRSHFALKRVFATDKTGRTFSDHVEATFDKVHKSAIRVARLKCMRDTFGDTR
jgi:hypothetical protein